MKNFIFTIGAFAILSVIAFPFIRDAYTRYEIMRRFGPTLSEQDRAAFNYWQGDMTSFVRYILARCEQTAGPDAKACQAYRD